MRPHLGATLILAVSVSGCAMHSDVVRLEQQLEARRQESQRSDSVIAANVAGLARLLQSVADSLAAQQTALAQLKGDVRTELYNVQQQLVAIQELTGQSQQRLSELRGQLEQSQRQLPAGSPAVPPATPAAGQAAALAVPAGQAPGMREPTADQLIDISVAQLRRGSPGAARVGFDEFVRKYPDHPRMADVLFMTGEAFSAEQRADSAAVAYRAVVQRFPQSTRAPSALYKLAMQALAAGRSAEARDDFNRVVTTYPQSPEAGLARDRLRSLPAR
ncbi:MAG: tetratricopeptide repeat protein [Gemmatimonadales bacterium]